MSSFNMFAAPHKLWGGNNTRTYVHVFIHLLTCQRGLAKLTHFSPQSEADSGEGQRDHGTNSALQDGRCLQAHEGFTRAFLYP